MTSSGTYAFDPGFGSVVLSAYARCGIRKPALTQEHFWDAGQEGNYLLSEWSNLQPLLWTSELISQSLTQGTQTYTLPSNVVMILVCYIETVSGSPSVPTDRVLGPLSTVEYASLPNKTNQAQPTSFWFNRQITPQITFWPVPDGNGPYTAYMQCVTQVQDTVGTGTPGTTTLDLPYRAYDAFLAGLAYRLARIHAPALEAMRKQDYTEAWGKFSNNDVENTPLFITPGIGTYYRQ